MVDPAGGTGGDAVPGSHRAAVPTWLRNRLVIAFAGCFLLPLGALLVGLLALPLVASAFLFYDAAQAAPAANAFETAPPCSATAPVNGCIRLSGGTIAEMSEHMSRRGRTTDIALDLPDGIWSARMTTLLPPPQWLHPGLPVDVTLYAGKVTTIAADGQEAQTDDSPVVREHDLLITGGAVLVFGLLLDGGILVSVRRRRKATGALPQAVE